VTSSAEMEVKLFCPDVDPLTKGELAALYNAVVCTLDGGSAIDDFKTPVTTTTNRECWANAGVAERVEKGYVAGSRGNPAGARLAARAIPCEQDKKGKEEDTG
jgi:hypothetical protein